MYLLNKKKQIIQSFSYPRTFYVERASVKQTMWTPQINSVVKL